MTFSEILAMPKGQDKAIALATEGLMIDGTHHKQWFLERILEALEINLSALREVLQGQDYDWEDGTEP